MAYRIGFTSFGPFERKLNISKKSIRSYEDLTNISAFSDEEIIDSEKYKNLFENVFGHHINPGLDVDSILIYDSNDPRRFIPVDSIDAYFIKEIYNPASDTSKIHNTRNYNFDNERIINYATMFNNLTATPIKENRRAENHSIGSSRYGFLLGTPGKGKSLLLCRIAYDCQINLRNYYKKIEFLSREDVCTKTSIAAIPPIPIYMDFRDFDDNDLDKYYIYKKMIELIKQSAILKHPLYNSEIGINIHGYREIYGKINNDNVKVYLLELVRLLWDKYRIRFFVMFDNIDRCHYKFERYMFFPKYRERQIRHAFDNLGFLPSIVNNQSELYNSGLCFLITSRVSTYHEAFEFPDIQPNETTGLEYQLEDVDIGTLINSRKNLFKEAVEIVEKNIKGRDFNDFKQIVDLIVSLEGNEDGNINIIRDIYELCHQGDRDFISFLSSLNLDYRFDAQQLKSFLNRKNHILLVLYISGFKYKYTEAFSSFPNLFLNDSSSYYNSDFSEAHGPHIHTYWLRYLILSYLLHVNNPADTEQMREVFVDIGKYDAKLFSLTLGLLSESNRFNCIKPILESTQSYTSEIDTKNAHRKKNIKYIELSSRGKRLIQKTTGRQIPICFHFDYLQLVIDDNLMHYPSVVFNEIFKEKSNLKYLYANKVIDYDKSKQYLQEKMPAVLTFIHVLEASFKAEMEYRSEFYNILRNSFGSDFDIDFERIYNSTFDTYLSMLSSLDINQRVDIVEKIREEDKNIAHRYNLLDIFNSYFANPILMPFNS